MSLKHLSQTFQDNLRLFGAVGLVQWGINYSRWYLRHTNKVRYIEIPVNDYRLVVDLRDVGIAKELMVNGTREEEHVFILQQFLRPGMHVLDCGANIGYYAVLMARLLGPTGCVWAIEPDPANFHLLNLNLRLNGLDAKVTALNVGLAQQLGVERFFKSVMSNRHTFHPHEYGGTATQVLSPEPPLEVAVMALADFVREYGEVDLVRMDVEGYEVEIFQSLVDQLPHGPTPSILFEVHPERYDGRNHDMERPLRQLFQHGYTARYLASDQHSHVGAAAFQRYGYGPAHIEVLLPRCDRAVYSNIQAEHAVALMCHDRAVRAALLVRCE